jgi:hypothetical protein
LKRLGILVLSLLVVSGLAATSAVAAVTFHQGPTFTDQGGDFTVRLFAEASGLGNADLTGTVAFSGTVQYTCQNKGGATAPGQPLQIQQQVSQSARANPKNGRATIDLTASFTPPATVPGTRSAARMATGGASTLWFSAPSPRRERLPTRARRSSRPRFHP